MGVLKEYVCLAHGGFESDSESPECPEGCNTVERAFFTPPGLASARTKGIDNTLQSLAKSYNLTDIGPAAMRRKALAAEKSQDEYKDFCERRFGGMGWGNVPKGGNLNVETGKVTGSGPGAVGAVSQVGAQTDATVGGLRDSHVGLKPIISHRDPENLTLASVR